MRKVKLPNRWKIYSHISRINKFTPDPVEFKQIFLDASEPKMPYGTIFLHGQGMPRNIENLPLAQSDETRRTAGETLELLRQQSYNRAGKSSAELSMDIWLRCNKLNDSERSIVVKEVVDRLCGMTNECALNLEARHKYELAYLTHAADMVATRLQVVQLELRARLEPRSNRNILSIISHRNTRLSLPVRTNTTKEKRLTARRAKIDSDLSNALQTVQELMKK